MFTLAHLSDPHLGPLPPAAVHHLLSKRIIGYVNWHRKRGVRYRPEILLELIANIQAAAPDHIAVTGDLVNIALQKEMELARAWLETLGPPDRVTVIPGNHDAYVPGALARALRAWMPYLAGDARPDHIHFPFVRRRGPVGLVCLSSARASAPFLATGFVSDRQLREAGEVLAALGSEGLFRVVLIHHPPHPRPSDWHRRLINSSRLRAMLREAGAELILHGHDHKSTVGHIHGPDGRIAVVGVPSASNTPGGRHYPGGAFNLYRIAGAPGAFTCHMTQFGFTAVDAPASLIAERQLIG
jgi:3',5'-cyclic AMP phosphodiesterase CpdA